MLGHAPGVDGEPQGRRRQQALAVVGDDLDLVLLAGIDGERLLHDDIVADRQLGPPRPGHGGGALGLAVDAPDHLGADAAALIDQARGKLDGLAALLGAVGQQLDPGRGPESRMLLQVDPAGRVLVLALRIAFEHAPRPGRGDAGGRRTASRNRAPARAPRSSISVPLRDAAKKPAGVIASHWPSRPPMRHGELRAGRRVPNPGGRIGAPGRNPAGHRARTRPK